MLTFTLLDNKPTKLWLFHLNTYVIQRFCFRNFNIELKKKIENIRVNLSSEFEEDFKNASIL